MCGDVVSEIKKYLTGDKSALECLSTSGFLGAGEPKSRGYVLFKALKSGFKVSSLAKNLEWYEFEEFLKYIFDEYGYHVATNVRYHCGETVEFDLVAWRKDVAIVVEAKKWKVGGEKWRDVASRHLEKVRKCADKLLVFAPLVVPLVVTSTEVSLISGGVPVISISKIGSFLSSLDYLQDQIAVFR